MCTRNAFIMEAVIGVKRDRPFNDADSVHDCAHRNKSDDKREDGREDGRLAASTEDRLAEALQRRQFALALRSQLVSPKVNCFSGVPGLCNLGSFVTADEERVLITEIDKAVWDTRLARRVQHYGWLYDYTKRSVSASNYLGPLPEWANTIAKRLHHFGLIPEVPNQLIVNEYKPGQGISSHVDQPSIFGPVVCMLSLSSAAVMVFRKKECVVNVVMERRALVTVSGPARYEWSHEIPARKTDSVGPRVIHRGRRLSMTFRTIAKLK